MTPAPERIVDHGYWMHCKTMSKFESLRWHLLYCFVFMFLPSLSRLWLYLSILSLYCYYHPIYIITILLFYLLYCYYHHLISPHPIYIITYIQYTQYNIVSLYFHYIFIIFIILLFCYITISLSHITHNIHNISPYITYSI